MEGPEEVDFRRVASEILERLERGDILDEDEYLRRFPHFRDKIEEIFDVQRLLRLPTGAVADDPSPKETELVGEFRILRLLGEGGMGRVYEAEQTSLHRRVALKVFERTVITSDLALERFRREAGIAAKLSHPHIVPVHAFGEEAGVCYIAMELQDGRTLDEVITRLRGLGRRHVTDGDLTRALAHVAAPQAALQSAHPVTATRAAASERSGTGARNYIRRAAQLIAQVSDGLEYAHSMGIIHRDLKPANVIVRPDGTPLLMDFGIAREAGALTITRTGAFMGTIPYVSREQLDAKKMGVDHRTDIYSLGVTLYELVTLARPFDGDTTEEIARRIQTCEPPRPRKLNPSIPRDMQTIILKAMDSDRERRYPTAAEFAEDLRRFLRHEPIRARPTGPLLRLGRWAQRNPKLATSAAGIAVVAAAGLAATAHFWDVAETQHARSEEVLQGGRRAIEQLTRVAEEELTHVPRLEPEVERLLREALEGYRRFLAQKGDDPLLRYETAQAYRRVGDVEQKLGDLGPAEEAYRHAIALLNALDLEFQGNLDYRQELAESMLRMGWLHFKLGRLREAEDAGRDALRIREGVEASAEQDQGLADCYRFMGLVLRSTGKPEAAEHAYRRALDLLDACVARSPSSEEARHDAAQARNNFAIVLKGRGRAREAEALYREALSTLTRLLSDSPARAEYQQTVGSTHNNLGILLEEAGRLEEAEAAYRDALTLRQDLARNFPKVTAYRFELARTQNDLGVLLTKTGRASDAEKMYRDSLALRRKLVDDLPSVPEYQSDLARSYLNVANRLLDRNELDEARRHLDEAIQCGATSLSLSPGNRIYQRFQGGCYENLAEVFVRLRVHGEAAAAVEAMIRESPEGAQDFLEASHLLARCASVAQSDPSASQSARDASSKRYGDRAVDLLRKAVDRGSADPDDVRNNPAFDALRGRADFSTLAADLDRRAKASDKR